MDTLTPLGYKILLDRYALKDMRKNFSIGDTVVAITNAETGQREIGEILAIGETISVKLLTDEVINLASDYLDLVLEKTPEEVLDRVAKGIAKVESTQEKRLEWEEKFNWLLEDFKFVPAGRILAAAGTDQNLTYFNCYVIASPEDSRLGIMKTLTEMAEIMSRGGGVGINVSSLRPRKSYVRGVNGRASGAVSWGALYSFVTGLIEQGGSRRGALMLILNDWHPDILEFINSKREAGKIVNANISIGLSDKFMKAVEEDLDWDLVFPDTEDTNYVDWNGILEQWQGSIKKYKTIKARELWNALIESAWASAEPGLWFRDRANQMSNSHYFNFLIGTNPCCTGDTLVYTKEGLYPIKDIVDQQISVSLDSRLSEKTFSENSPVFKTGEKQVYLLETKEGFSLKATSDHKIMTPKGWVELSNLNPGDKLHVYNSKGGFGPSGTQAEGRLLGWLVGDGSISDQKLILYFYDKKKELGQLLLEDAKEIAQTFTVAMRNYDLNIHSVENRNVDSITSSRLYSWYESEQFGEKLNPKNILNKSEVFQRSFLQALFSADGTFLSNIEKGISVRLSSISKELLKTVQQMLLNFGIYSRIYWNRREAAFRPLPDGNGGYKDYFCQELHELVVSKDSVDVFAKEIRFLLDYKNEALDKALTNRTRGSYATKFLATVASITPLGIETVYDLTESSTHSFIANGIVVHNCGEQNLGAYSVCNLGAINLSKFYKEETNDVDWQLLKKTVQYAVRFLDNVIDATPYFLEETENRQKSERRVGLNTMGLAELMIDMGLRYGSQQSLDFIEILYTYIRDLAYSTSIQLAQEKGPFPKFSAEDFLKSGFITTLSNDLRKNIEDFGMRNVTLLTQAPNGTIGTMVNTSTGIEPFFSWEFYRKSRLGLHKEYAPVVAKYYEQHPDATELPDYFVTAMDLTPEEHVRVQAQIQKYIDSAISKTANLPNDYTVEQVSDLYMLMYKLGCRGGTVYRDGSRSEQVLMLDTKTETNEKHTVYSRPESLAGTTKSKNTSFGKLFVTINHDSEGQPFEVFINLGKAGSDIRADMEALGRLLSLQLRTTKPEYRADILKLAIEQLKDIGGSKPSGIGPNKILSIPDAIAKILQEYFEQEKQETVDIKNADICPSCGTSSLIKESGCETCLSCGYAAC